MDKEYNKIGLLSGSTLKIIACIFMTVDHVGLVLLPQYDILRILGRLAFPMFAFFIAEGCRYSKNKLRRFLTVFSIGIAFFIFYLVYNGQIYGNIFLTFSFSIFLDGLLTACKKYVCEHPKWYNAALSSVVFVAALAFTYHLFDNVTFEYRFAGMMLPVIINAFSFKGIALEEKLKPLDSHYVRLALLTVGSILMCINANLGYMQYYCLLAVPILAMYNGRVGCKKMKYLFYIFYPSHLVIIEAVALFISLFEK